MMEVSITEMALLVWAVAASGIAGHYYTLARARERLLIGAAHFARQLIEDDDMRNHMREAVTKAQHYTE